MKVKFRLWDGLNRQYAVSYHGMRWMVNFPSTGESWIDLADLETIDPDHDMFIIQQFTGIIDKNGVEIYEGDIVVEEHDHDKDCIYDGVFTYMKHHVIIKHHGYFTHDEDDMLSLVANTNGDGQNSYVEVVGNIYDNRELRPK